MLSSLHTHTSRCHHAIGKPIDYLRAAYAQDPEARVGFTDHVPNPWNYHPGIRMSVDEIPDYLSDIQKAAEAFPTLTVIPGFECEFSPLFAEWYKTELIGKHNVHFLIGSMHWLEVDGKSLYLDRLDTPELLDLYAAEVEAMVESGLFALIGHPDGYCHGYRHWDKHAERCAKRIATAAAKADIPLEINGYAIRRAPAGEKPPYPRREFWEVVASCGAKAICNSDAHEPDAVLLALDRCDELRQKCGVKEADTARWDLFAYSFRPATVRRS